MSISEKRKQYAAGIMRQFPGKITPVVQQKILTQEVILGMSPYEAHLAAGAFVFKVKPDAAKWPISANPYEVMWCQSIAPDNSEIWMMFETGTQFSKRGLTKFRVYFD
ncbi:MAG TPA: hypothetical protein VNF99_05445, partial [Stellaceae bacterium]|nr:hypothetical protein [Stellaceae bacterium]